MPKLREITTATVVRGENWAGACLGEPYEAGWATEALAFLRLLKLEGDPAGTRLVVEISADGMHWVAEGSTIRFPSKVGEVGFVRLREFGNWLRFTATLPDGVKAQVLVTLQLK